MQRRAHAQHSELRLVALKGESAVAGAGPATTPLAPGATVGPDGLSALPFTFEFSGTYFDLRDILQTVRRSVSFRSGDLKARGRLLTIDGLTLDRSKPTSAQTKAVVTATAFIAPDASASSQLPAPPICQRSARPAAGTYGLSTRSGDPIPDGRLEAEPLAELTVDEEPGGGKLR